MRVLIRAETVIPGMSGGLEHFAAGLIGGLVEVTDPPDEVIVAIARGSEQQWESLVPAARQLRYFSIAAAGSVVLAALKLPRSQMIHAVRDVAVRARPTRVALAMFRRYVEVGMLRELRPAVVYYPIPLHEVRAHPAVITVHDLRYLEPHLHEERGAKVLRHNVAGAAAIVTGWPHPFHRLIEEFPNAATRSFMIPFPVLSPPRPEVASEGMPGDTFLLYPATIGKDKNHVMLIEAMAVLNQRRHVRLICTGAKVSPTYDSLLRRGNALGVSDLIEYRGFVSAGELDGLYRRAAVVVVPSLWEAASGPIFEAFAYGRPVACSDIPPIRSQVEFSGATVSFFDPANPVEMADAIERVLEDPEPFIRGSAAAAAAIGTFTWSCAASDYLAVWRWVASGKQGQRPVTSMRVPGF
jgi:glycosyltransferase involved in cell wall biosynthesis